MEPLRTTDPSRLGDYRLLRRLGAGGMGVVFLARAPGGAFAAVKVVRASYADDAGFRARFRREIEVARQVDSPWVVPLLGADADAEDPWLATAFVPGPSLTEALEDHGPWSPASVCVLGLRLAEALDAVHRAGLVHRDVKPGNLLLAPDGPRLIDFGIARTPEGTALTSTGVIVGSPGFLSPEQARARGAGVGPPSDVFSLGCVLAFAATGVRPFGGGAAAGMLLRTVYDDPELAGLPAALEPVVRACLDKDPARRPTAVEVGAALDAAVPADRERWLPEPVTRLIADRSAIVLAMGAIEPTRVSAPASTARGDAVAVTKGPMGSDAVTVTSLKRPEAVPPGASRRRFLALGSTGAAGVLAAGGGAWWWSNRGGRKAGAGASPSSAPRTELAVAFQGDLSGATGEVGRAQLNGARLAVARVNADADRPLRLKLRAYDDGGEPDRTLDRARRLVADKRVLAVLGPTSDDCFLATETTYTKAVLPVVTVSVGVTAQVRRPARPHCVRMHNCRRPMSCSPPRATSISRARSTPARCSWSTTGPRATSPGPSATSSSGHWAVTGGTRASRVSPQASSTPPRSPRRSSRIARTRSCSAGARSGRVPSRRRCAGPGSPGPGSRPNGPSAHGS